MSTSTNTPVSSPKSEGDIKITLPDGTEKVKPTGTTPLDIARDIGPGLAKAALAAKVNDQEWDLFRPIEEDARLELLTWKNEEGQEVYWHSSTHLMAQAIKRVFPKAQLTIGPVVRSGPGFFYYDIDYDEHFTPEDLEKIEAEMKKIVAEDLPVERRVLSREEAVKEFEAMGEHFKAEIINDLGEEVVSVYKQGEFQDLCRGPHLPSTGKVKAFKLTAVAGAYWRGDANNKMLQRIYGISFPDKKDLKRHLKLLEEAKKRDHRRLGKELDLFSFQEEGPGFPFWHGKGTFIFNALADFIREKITAHGYQEVRAPLVLNDDLWHRSGHYQNFKENMYFTRVEEESFAVKPMNCPGHNLIYKNSPKSYRDLPLKIAEFGICHRHELHGSLHGLFRVRSFTQDDAHVYCAPENLQEEIIELIDLTLDVYKTFGFENTRVFLATRPEKFMGSPEMWDKATEALANSLKERNLEYAIKEGEGAFYGPKIEFNIQDSLDRYWQCGTIQVDFSMPERFELTYTGSDNEEHRPVMVHRAILGSLERFIGILIENYAGKFPLWLSPVQAIVLPIGGDQNEVAREYEQRLRAAGLRAETDNRSETIGYKIRQAIAKKINYFLVVGKKEAAEDSVSVRKLGEEKSTVMKLDEFAKMVNEAVLKRENQ